MGFAPSRADSDLWIKKMGDGFAHIGTCVDGIIVAAKDPQEHIAKTEQECAPRNIEVDPSCHLGSRLKRRPDGKSQMNMEEHIKERIKKCESKHSVSAKKDQYMFSLSEANYK